MRCIVTITLIFSYAIAGFWPNTGGANERNGLSDELGPAVRTLAWESNTLPGTITMPVYTWQDRLVTMRYSFSPMQGPLVCHSLRTGESLWARLYRPGGKFIPMGFMNGRIYVRNFRETGHDSVFCIDAANGDILWQSRWTANLGIVWDAVLAANGDPIFPGGEFGIVRLGHLTGDTVWTNNRPIPNTGAEWLAAHDGILFTWTGYINTPKRLLAIDIETGVIRDSSAVLPGDGDQEWPFAIGPDGILYLQRDGGDLYALRYSRDSGFRQLWIRSGLDGGVWMNFGSTRDSNLIAADGRRLVILDRLTGQTLRESPELAPENIVPRVSVDRHGNIYANISTMSGGVGLYALDSMLQILWYDPIAYNYYSGPALTEPNLLVTSGPGTLLRCYAASVPVNETVCPRKNSQPTLTVTPSVCRSGTCVSVSVGPSPIASQARLMLVSATGRPLRSFVCQDLTFQTASLPTGVYFLRSGTISVPLIVVK